MDQFIRKYQDEITGVLSGFDRLVFKGSLRRFCFSEGVRYLLHTADVMLKEFKPFVDRLSKQVRAASVLECERLGRPMIYLASSATNKEEIARKIAEQDKVSEGLVCVLECVESCNSFVLNSNKETNRLEIKGAPRKCMHIYHYYMHPMFGFMNARLQTWLPLGIQICINGREWLCRQLDREGIGYVRQDNCLPNIESFSRAQELVNEQLRADFPLLLGEIAIALNPVHEQIFEKCPADYYWSVCQSEWATDITFSNPQTLRRLYPMFVQHGISALSSPDVMRFLGRKVTARGAIDGKFLGEVVSDVKRREEGVRIKHCIDHNSVKMYDKAYTLYGNVLRIEATTNNAEDFKVERTAQGDVTGELKQRSLRRGVVDIALRAQVSEQVNERYLEALSSVDTASTLQELLCDVTQPTTWRGKRVRALNPFAAADIRLFEAVSRGEFTINGLRNRDLQRIFFDGDPADTREARSRSAWVTRQLRMLRAHQILTKMEHSHRYQLTSAGRRLVTAVLTAHNTRLHQLLPPDIYKEAA